MNTAQRRIVTRTLFTVAAVCVPLLVGALLLFAGASHTVADGVFVVIWLGWPIGLIGLVAWLVGLYVRAGGQREFENPTTTPSGKSRPDPSSLDPMTIAGLAAMLWADKKRPFIDFKNPDVEIPEDHNAPFIASFWGYQFFLYLKLIEEKFGSEITSLVEECLRITLNRLPDKLGDQFTSLFGTIRLAWEAYAESPKTVPGRPDITVPFELCLAFSILTLTRDSPFYVPPAERANHPPTPDFKGLDVTLATCLEQARAGALEVFAPIVDRLGLKPEAVEGFKVGSQAAHNDQPKGEPSSGVEKLIDALDGVMSDMRAEAERLGLRPEDMVLTRDGIKPAEITWSEHPGCFERHLQRKHNNPLFPEAARRVTIAEVAAARDRDAHEAEAFRDELRSMVEGLAKDLSGEAIPYSKIDALRQRIDALQERANELGGYLHNEREALAKLRAGTIGAMRAAVADHPELIAMLDQAAERERAIEYLATNIFIAQMGRTDSPITAADAIPALLTEDADTIRACLKAMAEQDRREMVRSEAAKLLRTAIDRGDVVPGATEKLQALAVEAGSP